jgi:hypothetical protein
MVIESKIEMREPISDARFVALEMSVDDGPYVRALFDVHEEKALEAVLTSIWRRTEAHHLKLERENRYPVTPGVEKVRALRALFNPPISRPPFPSLDASGDGRKKDRKPSAAEAAEPADEADHAS